MTYARATDSNQADIVLALRKCGCAVFVTSRVGQGFPDLCVRRPDGSIVLMEVKRPGAPLTPAEYAFLRIWEQPIVHSAEEALVAAGVCVE